MKHKHPLDLSSDPHAGKIIAVVVIAVFNRKGEVLLLKRSKPPFAGFWEFSGGRVEFGERLADAARRELLEETGLRPKKLALVNTYESHLPNYHRLLFLFSGTSDETEVRLSEQSAFAWKKTLPKNVIPIVRTMFSDAKKAALKK